MTNIVNLPNIDGKIWNIEHKVLDIIAALANNNHCVIDLNSEGPCCESLGLYEILDKVCNQFGYDKSQIVIRTRNQLEQHNQYRIKKYPPLYFTEIQNFMNGYPIREISFDNHIKHFGLFIGRSNWSRMYLAAYVWNHYRDQSCLTFHFDIQDEFHKLHIGLDDMMRNMNQSIVHESIVRLLASCPIKGPDLPKYPILSPAHFGISKIYHTFFLEIVCETYCQGKSFYPTEKIWRPIAMKKPFLVLGPKNYYDNLRSLGFRTFSNWWDESFTNDDVTYQLKLITEVIDQLGQLDQSGLEALQIDMEDTLEHNRDLLKNLSDKHFTDIWQ